MAVRIGPSVHPGAPPLLLLDELPLLLLDEPPLLLEEEPAPELPEEDPPEELDPLPLPDPLAPLLPDDDDVPLLPEAPEDEPVPDEPPDEPVLDEPPDDPVPDEPLDEPAPESASIPTKVVPPQASTVTSASVAGAHFGISPKRSIGFPPVRTLVCGRTCARIARKSPVRFFGKLARAGHKRDWLPAFPPYRVRLPV
jgi:hypothetical protein